MANSVGFANAQVPTLHNRGADISSRAHRVKSTSGFLDFLYSGFRDSCNARGYPSRRLAYADSMHGPSTSPSFLSPSRCSNRSFTWLGGRPSVFARLLRRLSPVMVRRSRPIPRVFKSLLPGRGVAFLGSGGTAFRLLRLRHGAISELGSSSFIKTRLSTLSRTLGSSGTIRQL